MTPQPSPLAELTRLIRDARARGFPLDDNDLRREIVQLVDERQAEAMMLYYMEQLTQVQVAARMGIAQKNVSKLLKKGALNLAARIVALIEKRAC